MANSLSDSSVNPLVHGAQIMGEHLPNVLAAVGIVLLGWLVAILLRRLARYFADRVQQNLDRIKWLQTRTQQAGIYRRAPVFFSGLIFWVVLLFFLVEGNPVGRTAVKPPCIQNLTFDPIVDDVVADTESLGHFFDG